MQQVVLSETTIRLDLKDSNNTEIKIWIIQTALQERKIQ